mgnify:FL=1
MCTALFLKGQGRYFGRNLDFDFSYGEQVCVVPRRFPLPYRNGETDSSHLSFLGMAFVQNGYPLFYDGTNEAGLSIAGLNFVGNACYNKDSEKKKNIAQFEFIPYVLSTFKTVGEVEKALDSINITDTPYSESLPCASLHYMIADKERCIVVEFVKDGTHIYDNPFGAMTNNPAFDMQVANLNNYQKLSEKDPVNTFGGSLPLSCYSRGMGSIGLPGDLSSMGRFVRACFGRSHSLCRSGESEISQFFHLLRFVEQPRGLCQVKEGAYEITIYTSCVDMERGIYYYSTYGNSQINAVDMHRVDLGGSCLFQYPVQDEENIAFRN